MMRKCLIILMGLLATSAFAGNKCENGDYGACLDGDSFYGLSQGKYRQQEQDEYQRQQESRRWDPVIVNGPDRARMYYPSPDGLFYQTYER